MTNIVLCGGNGTRLWPISRTLMPKQFVKLIDGKSLFQLTLQRNETVCSKRLVVSNTKQYFLSLDQIEEMGYEQAQFILEPIGKNTAPAIALACFMLDADEIVLVTPSDHLIEDERAYVEAVKQAKEIAQKGALVTFGIEPTFAETGFGYIQTKIEKQDSKNGLDVVRFHEKPDKERAQRYIDENAKALRFCDEAVGLESRSYYFWNSGMFCFKAGVFLEELKKHALSIYEACFDAYKTVEKIELPNHTSYRISLEAMKRIPEESIDYAVMERSDKVKAVAANMGWSDLGSFDALAEVFPSDENGNTKNDNLIAINSKNNFVYPSERLVALVDIDDLIVVDTPDALLISKKGTSQKIKTIVKELKGRESELHHIHLTAHRPWGTYTILEDTPGYKIKRIEVKPKKRLSLQKHFHRNEHWVVVKGRATVTINDKVFFLDENESTYIKAGDSHRLANDTNEPLVIIEAQVGSYTGEDDIVRLDDDYVRF